LKNKKELQQETVMNFLQDCHSFATTTWRKQTPPTQ